jgi:hypothetical protein
MKISDEAIYSWMILAITTLAVWIVLEWDGIWYMIMMENEDCCGVCSR